MARQLLFLLALLSTPALAEDAQGEGFWQKTGALFRTIGHGVAEAGRELGHGLRDLGNATADGIREGADASVEAGRELGNELDQAVDEIGD